MINNETNTHPQFIVEVVFKYIRLSQNTAKAKEYQLK